ncbi:MAG: SAM-dependent chlorinase/fluorinase [Spirochaetaceae bacterium]|nr:MAG: SAM-dependent chlorinase/fluorinase [Spirochaetaceae bacterium]
MNSRIVALLTDFGCRDGYTGIMKGVILSQDPGIRIIDLTHDIDPHDLISGAYILYTAWDHFPQGTAFCAVVDPGVGSDRGALLAEINDRYLIAPDNGLISLLIRMIPSTAAYALRTDAILEVQSGARSASWTTLAQRPSLSRTFHGRDLFAPAAALCATGDSQRIRGNPIQPVLLPAVVPEQYHRGLRGQILHVDRFGNCISSLHRTDLDKVRGNQGRDGGITIQAGSFQEHIIRKTYAEVAIGAPLCLIGSSGFLEIAIREGSAAKIFGFTPGQSLTVTSYES